MRKLIYKYDQEWQALGYKAKMGSGKLTLPPPIEFRRVYHFLKADYAIASIAMRRLKAARANDMNDPYEMLPYQKTGEMAETLELVKKSANLRVRFLCFSADWGSPAMWAHYGDRHKGICLGFNIPRELERKVEYASERTKGESPLNILAEIERFYWILSATKCEDWRYEEEIRILVNVDDTIHEGGLDFVPFGGQLQLAEVILGLRCPLAVETVRGLVEENHQEALVFQTREADQHYRMVPNENTCPWLPE